MTDQNGWKSWEHLGDDERVDDLSYQKMRLHIHMSEIGKHEN